MNSNASNESFAQTEEFVIRDLETLKVIADPLRLQILEIVFDHPHTVKQIASQLDLPPSKLYYHMNLLEKRQLIAVASTRMVSGIQERSYQAAARNFRVMKGLLTPQRSQSEKDEGVALFVDAILDDAKQDIKHHVKRGLINTDADDHALSLRLARATTRLTEAQALEFHQRLRELIAEFQDRKADGANADEQGYAMVIAMYPTQRGTRPQDEN